MRRMLSVVLVLATIGMLVPQVARAQVWKRIKQDAAEKYEARKAKTDSNLVEAAAKAVDSTLEKTGRGADAVVSAAGTLVDTVLTKTERGITEAFNGGGSLGDRIAKDLADGRAVLREIRFGEGSDELEPSGVTAASELASALEAATGVWLLEVHTDATGDSGADQALAARRARTLKLHLLEAGLAPERLFTTPHGSSRPAADDKGNARIEIARMQ